MERPLQPPPLGVPAVAVPVVAVPAVAVPVVAVPAVAVPVTCHLSPVTCQLSPVSCFLFPVSCFLPKEAATRKRLILAAIPLGLIAAWAVARWCYVGPVPLQLGAAADAQAELATWPWPGARTDAPYRGVTHLMARSSDGTVADLLEFDFAANPGLRLEIYDQDEDDARPHDDEVAFWERGVGQAARHLNDSGRGPVIAACNGLFFATQSDPDGRRIARHVAPVVLDGRVLYNVGNHRWTFGVRYDGGRPTFTTLHLPHRRTLAETYAYAAAGAQCLTREGRPLRLQPFPRPGGKPLPQPVPCAPDEAGHIPGVDHMKTSRTSWGWSRDSRRLWLLIVKEPDSETGSSIALRRGLPVTGGWTVADLQAFWLAKRVWGAVNIDGGDVTQMAYLRKDGRYELVPPRWATMKTRMTLPASLQGAPQGGTLMYLYVRGEAGDRRKETGDR